MSRFRSASLARALASPNNAWGRSQISSNADFAPRSSSNSAPTSARIGWTSARRRASMRSGAAFDFALDGAGGVEGVGVAGRERLGPHVPGLPGRSGVGVSRRHRDAGGARVVGGVDRILDAGEDVVLEQDVGADADLDAVVVAGGRVEVVEDVHVAKADARHA